MSNAPFRWDHRTPCGNCPYRKDAPREHWHREEFERLVEQDRSELGAVYGCHKQNGRGCIGWLLDQRRRNCSSIALRVAMMRGDEAAKELNVCVKEAHTAGHPMFASIESMCRANGVKVPPRPADPYAPRRGRR